MTKSSRVTLQKEDVIGALKYLIRLKLKAMADAVVDDIDHLGQSSRSFCW